MSDNEVSINDLLGGLDDTNEFGDLKKMANNQPQPLQDLSRVAASKANIHANYEIAKDNVGAWAGVTAEIAKQRTVTFEDNTRFYNNFTPAQTSFGSEIEAMLKESKLTSEAQATLEDDAMSQFSEAEIRAKEEQLSRLRKLQMYSDEKARRWKKIKSKNFRRLHKKDMSDLTLEELAEVDPEAFQARLQKMEAERARERATQRHKNTSQWVRRVIARGLNAATEDERAHYEEQLRLGEELTRKIQGMKFDNDDDEEEEDPNTITIENPANQDPALKSLMGMKFMQEHEKRRKAQLEKMESGEDDHVEAPKSGIITFSNQKMKFSSPFSKSQKAPSENSEPAENSGATENSDKSVNQNETKENHEENNEKISPPEVSSTQDEDIIPKKSRKRNRFITASLFIQPTQDELKAAAEKLNIQGKEEQKQIIAEAFGLQEEFEKQKEAEIAKEVGEDENTIDSQFIKGWGSWVGPNLKESPGVLAKKAKLEKARKEELERKKSGRRDKQFANVIISEQPDQSDQSLCSAQIPAYQPGLWQQADNPSPESVRSCPR